MTITELIEVLTYHIRTYGDLEVINFLGTTVNENNELELESNSTVWKKLSTDNTKKFLENIMNDNN